MKIFLGVLLILVGTVAARVFGFGALVLGGGSSSQAAEAPQQLAGAFAGAMAAVAGVTLVRGPAVSERKPPRAP